MALIRFPCQIERQKNLELMRLIGPTPGISTFGLAVIAAALLAGCQSQPPQIIVNANSSADKTQTYTETNTETNSVRAEAKLNSTNTTNATNATNTNRTDTSVAVTPVPRTATTPAFGTCTWNGSPERCTARWSGQTAMVTWASDGKVTSYDFSAGTVYDSVNGQTYSATSTDYSTGCISTANGKTCIYR